MDKIQMMNSATISADIISYTSLNDTERRRLESGIRMVLDTIKERFDQQTFYGRLVKGDLIECATDNVKSILRIALLIKTFIKSLNLGIKSSERIRLKYFLEHGIRMAIAVAPLATLDQNSGIIDGEAIYLSGRAIQKHSTSDKKKIVIKNTMYFYCSDTTVQTQYEVIVSLLDTILSRCSSKQCQVVYHKLLNFSETEIAEKLGKYQSTISQHSTAAGWLSIEKAVNYFEKNIF